ncbi:unnamed protein product [Musa textilis]
MSVSLFSLFQLVKLVKGSPKAKRPHLSEFDSHCRLVQKVCVMWTLVLDFSL